MTTTTRQVAFLRGINVGRNKRIAMADLRQLLTGLGYSDVTTYLQSGNAIFSTTATRRDVCAAIEESLVRVLEIEAKVVVRTHAELVATVAADPFCDVAMDPAKHLVGFLSREPDVERIEALCGFAGAVGSESYQLRIVGNHLYLWCPRGVLDSLFSTVNWDQRLGVVTTMRNWNTVTKLADLTRG
ncbi:MAG: DUF1697 domain-containing protein [Dehalococcoidia bacterium]